MQVVADFARQLDGLCNEHNGWLHLKEGVVGNGENLA